MAHIKQVRGNAISHPSPPTPLAESDVEGEVAEGISNPTDFNVDFDVDYDFDLDDFDDWESVVDDFLEMQR